MTLNEWSWTQTWIGLLFAFLFSATEVIAQVSHPVVFLWILMALLTKDNWGGLFFSLSLCYYSSRFNVSPVGCQWSCHFDRLRALVYRVLVGNTGNNISHNPPSPPPAPPPPLRASFLHMWSLVCKFPGSTLSVTLGHSLHSFNHQHSWSYALYYLCTASKLTQKSSLHSKIIGSGLRRPVMGSLLTFVPLISQISQTKLIVCTLFRDKWKIKIWAKSKESAVAVTSDEIFYVSLHDHRVFSS